MKRAGRSTSTRRRARAAAALCRRCGRGAVGGGPATDPERSQQEAARRARAKLRRYAAANRLNRLGTLTYAGEGCSIMRQLRVDVAEFFRGLRRRAGGEPLPYVWVPEWHPGGHGLHVHFAVGRYVRHGADQARSGVAGSSTSS